MGRPKKEQVEQIEDMAGQIEEGCGESDSRDLEFFSTGCDIFDLVIGGGLPFGKLFNLIGDSSTGKSFFVSEIIASARKKYGNKLKWKYLDCEAGYSFDSKAIWGFNVVNENNPIIETVEEFAIEIRKTLSNIKPDEKLIYVIDSYDSLSSEDEKEQYNDKLDAIEKGKDVSGSYGMAKAKFINSFFRMMIREIKEKNCLFIVVSQTRDVVGGGMYGPKKQRNGGSALDFYSSVIIWLKVLEKYGKAGRQTGISVEIKNSKNKIGVPFRKGVADIIFNFGCDNVASNIKFLYDLITPEGKVREKIDRIELEWDGNKMPYRKLIDFIEENNLEEELTKRVYEKWGELENKASDTEGRKRRY